MFERICAFFAKAPLFCALLIGIAGIVAVDSGYTIWAGLIFGILTVLCFSKPFRKFAVVGMIAILIFGIRHHQRLEEIRSFPLSEMMSLGREVEINGQAWISGRPEKRGNSLTGLITLTSIEFPEKTIPCEHKVPVWIQGKPLDLKYGDVVSFSGLLRPLEKPLAPGGFDPQQFYFRSHGSLGRLEIRPGDAFEILEVQKRGPSLVHWAHRSRDWMESALRHGLPDSEDRYIRVILAMALGAREDSPEEIEELFRLSGTMHIFAVSGLHVGIIAGLFLILLRSLGLSTRAAICIVIPLVLFYALVTGFRPSAVRAALMASVFLSGFLFLQKPRLLNSLGAAGLLLLLFDSQQTFMPGFQLSFAVLLAIAILARPLQERLFAPLAIDSFLPRSLVSARRRFTDSCVRWVCAALAISVVSWIGSAPLLVWHFDGISLIGILSNLFMIPLAIAIVTLAAISVLTFGIKLIWIAGLLNKVNVGLTLLLTILAQFFASVPGSYTNTNFNTAHRNLSPLQVDVMGRRGGSASLLTIRSPDDDSENRWLIDTGGKSTYRQQVLPLLRSSGVNQLRGLILSHGDMAHIGAAPEVISSFPPAVLMESPLKNRSRVYSSILETTTEGNVPRVPIHSGQTIHLEKGVTCRVLYPKQESSLSLADDRTLVLKILDGHSSILFTFDSGFEVQKRLIESGVDLKSDIWVKGQNSGTQSGIENFLKAVSPRAVISSNSEFPAYERLSSSFISLLNRQNIDLYDLEKTGSVNVSFQKDGISITPFLGEASPKFYKTREFKTR